MSIPEVNLMMEYLTRHPLTDTMVAAYLGYKPPGKDGEGEWSSSDGAAGLAKMIDSLKAAKKARDGVA